MHGEHGPIITYGTAAAWRLVRVSLSAEAKKCSCAYVTKVYSRAGVSIDKSRGEYEDVQSSVHRHSEFAPADIDISAG